MGNVHCTAVARDKDILDVFYVGANGTVRQAFWSPGPGWDYGEDWDLGGSFPPNAPIVAVSRRRLFLDLFCIGNDGQVYTNFWNPDVGKWGSENNARRWISLGGAFPPNGRLAVWTGYADHLEVLAVGKDGQLQRSWWGNGNSGVKWHGFLPLKHAAGIFEPGAPVSGVSRDRDFADIAAVTKNKEVVVSWYTPADNKAYYSEGPLGLVVVGTGFTGDVKLVSRQRDIVDLVAVREDGNVLQNWRHQGGPWGALPTNNNHWSELFGADIDLKAAVLTPLSRNPGNLEVYTIATKDGAVYETYWSEGMNHFGPAQDGKKWLYLGGKLNPGTEVAAVARYPSHVDLFAVNYENQRIYTKWWDASSGWHDWFPILKRNAPPPPPVPPPVPTRTIFFSKLVQSVRMEKTDEISLSLAVFAVKASGEKIYKTFTFPDGAEYWSMKNDDNSGSGVQIIPKQKGFLLSGDFTELSIVALIVEIDSGGVAAIREKFQGAAGAAATAAASPLGPAAVFVGAAATYLTGKLYDWISDFLGNSDDPFNPATLTLNRPNPGEYVLRATGRDDGGDDGVQDIYFTIE